MEHSFDVDIAREYGINCAILLKYIWFWIEKNRANDRHMYDGKYWAYNSVKAFELMFPYMSAKAIRTALQKLEDEGLIETGQFNEKAYDRTKWYCITPKGQMHLSKRANGSSQKGKPIPVNNNILSFNSSVSTKYTVSKHSNTENLIYILTNTDYKNTEYINSNTKLLDCIKEWMTYKDEKGQKYSTESGIKSLLTEIVNHDKEDGTDLVIDAIHISMSRDWTGIFWNAVQKTDKPKQQTYTEVRRKEPKKPKDDGRLPMEEYLKLNPNI